MREFNLPCLKTVILTVIYCILAGSGMTYAQKVITGTVTDSLSGSTLPGVSVNVQGTLEGVSTEIDGTFELSTEQEKVILVFSYIGYQEKAIALAPGDRKSTRLNSSH